MKKLVIASAVAAVMASSAAFAETTVYGKAGLAVELGTQDAVKDENGKDADRQGVTNVSSRFGFKYSDDLGNGMKSFARYEAATGDDQGDGVGTRLLYAGLEGDFGQVGVGSQWTPSYTLVRGAHDPFNTVGCNSCGGGFLAPFRTSDAIWYLNTFGSVTFAVATVADDGSDTINDATDIAVSVPVGPVTIGIAAQTYDGSNTPSPMAVNINWASGDFSVDVGLFSRDADEIVAVAAVAPTAGPDGLDGTDDDTGSPAVAADKGDDSTIVTAKYSMGANTLVAQFEDDGVSGETQTNLGLWHKMGKSTTLFAEISSGDVAADETNVGIVVLF